MSDRRRKLLSRRKLLLSGGGLFAGTFLYAWRIEPLWLRRCDVTVSVPRLPAEFDGYRIAQISDLHVGSGVPEELVRSAAAEVEAAEPDLIVGTGDYIHRGAPGDVAGQAADWISGLAAPDGKLAVLGNHDAQVQEGARPDAASKKRVTKALESVGWKVLENGVVEIVRRNALIRVVGLGDYWSGAFDPDLIDLEDAIVLEHNPDAVPRLLDSRPSLVLCGHTHGGQVAAPFLGPLILPVRHRAYAAGLYDLGDTRLYVNRGVGWLYRLRLFVRPEVTVMTLRTAAA